MAVCSSLNTDWSRDALVKGSGAVVEIAKATSCLLLTLRNIVIIAGIVFMLYGAILYLTSNGNPDKAKSARGTVTWALIAILIAVTLVSVLTFFFSSLLGVDILDSGGVINLQGIVDFIENF